MKNIAKTLFALFLIAFGLFIGIISVIYGIREQQEKEKFSRNISWKNKRQAEAMCRNEKIVQKLIKESPWSYGSRGYSLFIVLDNGENLEVNLKQFEKAKEGNECRTIF